MYRMVHRFLEVQDGVLDGVGKIVTRMSELKGLGSQDPMKSSQDIESYNLEFRDLQRQLYDMSQMTFNGVSLFANISSPQTGAAVESVFRDSTNHTVSIHTSTQGSQGSKISLHKAALLAALTMTNDDLSAQDAEEFGSTISNWWNNANDIIPLLLLNPQMFGIWMQYLWVSSKKHWKNISFLRAQVEDR